MVNGESRRPALGATAMRKNIYDNLEKKRMRRDQESFKKAKVLKKYSKLVAEEGFTSARVNVGKRPEELDTDRQKRKRLKAEKAAKPIAFKNALAKADERRSEIAASKAAVQEREAERAGKLKAREDKRKLHMKRTKKGQPVMKNVALALLDKIQASKR